MGAWGNTLVKYSDRLRERRGLMIVAVIGSVALPFPSAAWALGGDPTKFPAYLAQNDCELQVDPQTLHNVGAILESAVPSSEMAFEPNYPYRMTAARKSKVQAAAKQSGFTILGADPYIERVQSAPNTDVVVEILNEYTRLRGFRTELPKERTKTDIPEMKPFKGLGLDIIKTYVSIFMEYLSQEPLETADGEHVEELKLVGNLGGRDQQVGSTHPNGHTVYLEFDGLDPALFYHEKMHLTDPEDCGEFGSDRDTTWRSLNPKGVGYDAASALSYIEADSYFIRPYGQKFVTEDKATFAERTAGGIHSPLLAAKNSAPVKWEKLKLHLARREMKLPGITAYLARINYLPLPGDAPEG